MSDPYAETPEVEPPLNELLAARLTGAKAPALALENTPGFSEFVASLKHPRLLVEDKGLFRVIFKGCLRLPRQFAEYFTPASLEKAVSLVRRIDESEEPEALIGLLYPPRSVRCIPTDSADDYVKTLEALELFVFVEEKNAEVFSALEKKFSLAGNKRSYKTKLNWLETETTRLVPERIHDFTKIMTGLTKSRRDSEVGGGQHNGDLLSDLLKSKQLLIVLSQVDVFVRLVRSAGRQGFGELINSPNLLVVLERQREVSFVAEKLGQKSFGALIKSGDLDFILDNKSQIAKAAERNSGKDIVRNLAMVEPAQKADVLAMMGRFQMHAPSKAKKAGEKKPSSRLDRGAVSRLDW